MSNIPAIIQKIKDKNPNLRNTHDAVVLAIHFMMLDEGFRCVGQSEADQIQELPEGSLYPGNWNASLDSYTFKYKHSESSLTFVLKCVTLGNHLEIHGLTLEDQKPLSLSINVNDYVEAGQTLEHLDNYFKDLHALQTLLRISITRKLVPQLNKEGYEESVPEQQRQQTQTQTQPQPQAAQPRPPVAGPSRPIPSPYYDDPLRVGPVRGGPSFPTGPAFGTGAEDLYPSGFGPLRPTMPGGGFMPGMPGGGMYVGPRHPGFGPVGDPYAGGGMFPSRPAGVPPGARFDPYGPPPLPGQTFPGPSGGNQPRRGGGIGGDPTPDHERPPPDDDENPYWG